MRPEILNYLFSPVTRLRGVGPQAAQALAKLLPAEEKSLPILRDLLFHLPYSLLDRRKTWPLREAPAGVVATFVVRVDAHEPPPRGRARRPYRVRCSNATGDLTLVFFHASEDYLQRALPIGQERVISGQTEIFDFHLQMTHPDVIAPVSQLAEVQRVEPVYPLTAGLTSRRISTLIQQVLEGAPELPEWAPEACARHGWLGWKASLVRIHAPQDETDLTPESPARTRLAFDEALAGQLHLARLRRNMQVRGGRIITPTGVLRNALHLPWVLTSGQQKAIAEIDADLASGKRMARLLQGDVGSGKTVVALMAALAAAENGLQTALMVPTELIAQQHADNFRRLCEGLPVEIALLTGSAKSGTREEALVAIREGYAHIAVGTHALFQEHVRFHDLALIIVDEQHRFGVAQRMALLQKADSEGLAPHLLQMTATPIPRSLAMTVYGDMDCSWLTEKPAGRLPVETRVVPISRLEEVLARMEPALARGEKIYWICPMIEEEGLALDDTAAAETRFKLFKTRFGNQNSSPLVGEVRRGEESAFAPAFGLPPTLALPRKGGGENIVGLVHGRMKPELRDDHMRRFASGECRLLVATTVVEVGVDVPDATIIVIEQAERFGLAQLHQLRGRVGRSDKPSFCVLLYSDGAGEEARVRLSTLRESHDGLAIAEADLRIRGGGDLLGTRQSGLPAFRFLSLSAHHPLISEARAQAQKEAAKPGEALQILLALFGYPYE